jgi:diaminohydroxyphosphoribosylaminopyrimidine deaminase / 5-amino-6-(5-phosphoribosylamino)uracil reductase
VFRERPLIRVIFDRRLRTPPEAQVLSTGTAGPVIIVTTEESANRLDLRCRLEAAGATVLVTDGTIRGGLHALAERDITSVLIEGGAGLHEATWDEQVVDFVRLYVTPQVLGPTGVRFLSGRRVLPAILSPRRVAPIGPDVLIEGYVHGPR